MMLCLSGDMGQLSIGNVWYRHGPGVGMWKVGGNGDYMGWSGVWMEVEDRVGNGISAGSTCMGEGGRTTGIGIGGAGAGVGTGAARGGASAEGGTGGGWEKKNEGPGL
jgi:hypothetical protein